MKKIAKYFINLKILILYLLLFVIFTVCYLNFIHSNYKSSIQINIEEPKSFLLRDIILEIEQNNKNLIFPTIYMLNNYSKKNYDLSDNLYFLISNSKNRKILLNHINLNSDLQIIKLDWFYDKYLYSNENLIIEIHHNEEVSEIMKELEIYLNNIIEIQDLSQYQNLINKFISSRLNTIKDIDNKKENYLTTQKNIAVLTQFLNTLSNEDKLIKKVLYDYKNVLVKSNYHLYHNSKNYNEKILFEKNRMQFLKNKVNDYKVFLDIELLNHKKWYKFDLVDFLKIITYLIYGYIFSLILINSKNIYLILKRYIIRTY